MSQRSASHSEVERLIGDLALTFGWRHHHARCPGLTRGGYADGFPADVLVRDGRLLFVAIAGRRGQLIEPTRHWLEELAAVEVIDALEVNRGDLQSLWAALGGPDAAGHRERTG